MTYMLLLNCALKLVEEIILYYDARSKKHQRTSDVCCLSICKFQSKHCWMILMTLNEHYSPGGHLKLIYFNSLQLKISTKWEHTHVRWEQQ